MPKLAFPCNKTDDFLKFCHRLFNEQLMEANTEIYSDALDQATWDFNTMCKIMCFNTMCKIMS